MFSCRNGLNSRKIISHQQFENSMISITLDYPWFKYVLLFFLKYQFKVAYLNAFLTKIC